MRARAIRTAIGLLHYQVAMFNQANNAAGCDAGLDRLGLQARMCRKAIRIVAAAREFSQPACFREPS
jgi:hypothetical protein